MGEENNDENKWGWVEYILVGVIIYLFIVLIWMWFSPEYKATLYVANKKSESAAEIDHGSVRPDRITIGPGPDKVPLGASKLNRCAKLHQQGSQSIPRDAVPTAAVVPPPAAREITTGKYNAWNSIVSQADYDSLGRSQTKVASDLIIPMRGIDSRTCECKCTTGTPLMRHVMFEKHSRM